MIFSRTKVINFVKDFTDCPGGRLRIQGDFSGEQFREDVLKPALKEYDLVILQMNGAYGFPSSFLDEAFGVLVDELGFETVTKRIKFELTDDELALAEITQCLNAHSA